MAQTLISSTLSGKAVYSDSAGSTMIYVTHDQVEAMTMADKIVVLNAGKVEQIGAPMDLYRNPATPFVAGFIGSPKMNLYKGEIAKAEGCSTYGVRPEHVDLSRDHGRWKGKVHYLEQLGAETILHLDVHELGQLVVRIDGDHDYKIGEMLSASPMGGKEFRFN